MDFLELLFADRIRTLAKDLQDEARESAMEQAGQYWEPQADGWERDNTWAGFIQAAHDELATIAAHVRSL
jgi:hypothetical protein